MESHRREAELVRRLDEQASREAVNLLLLSKFQKQLNHQEEKKRKRKEDRNMILTGNAVCLTSTEMVSKAKDARDKKNGG